MRCRSVLLAGALSAVALTPGTHVASAATASCSDTTLLSGYAGDVFVVLGAQQPAPGDVTVCAAVGDGGGPPVPPPPPVPSGSCQTTPGATRILDLQTAGDERVWVYTAPSASGGTAVCAGSGGPVAALGARITVG